mmetsp:Transcript_52282/g.127750  ORF Transcript_52282/g.127750 Transcript_52282/m.127750 type:complete len:328 (-) Transcript_52282:296-1279(-)|eukprot:CAMPEP_0206243634 /NCGR_PEP_ID=MMETSP0047_2-20121206/17709_1 /ASSEMBLY_ACC=CAM_ASM_000192 /TAXON_ID=195065 /ORGANISM="Chroomonas mesostigmatica_cf, Strain CCMP1168" /LENGTH=327 /DNA_ID=CAMNT_0053668761 /DNA_START=265 /DNA_END=1248 /DNA_ORIENTATION=-
MSKAPPPESVARHGFAGRFAQKVGLKDSKVKVENETTEDLTVFHAPLPLGEEAIVWKCITILPKTKVVVESGEEGAMLTVQVHRHDGYFTPYWQRRLTHASGYKLIVRPEKLTPNCWTVAGNDGVISGTPGRNSSGAPVAGKDLKLDAPLLPGNSSGDLGLGSLGENLPDASNLGSSTPHNSGQREMRMVSPNLPPNVGGMPQPPPRSSGGAAAEVGSGGSSPQAPMSGGMGDEQTSLLAPGRGPTKVAGPASGDDAGSAIKEAACPVCKQPVYGSQPRTKNPADSKYYHMVCWQPTGGAVATRMPGDRGSSGGVEVKSFPPQGKPQ